MSFFPVSTQLPDKRIALRAIAGDNFPELAKIKSEESKTLISNYCDYVHGMRDMSARFSPITFLKITKGYMIPYFKLLTGMSQDDDISNFDISNIVQDKSFLYSHLHKIDLEIFNSNIKYISITDENNIAEFKEKYRNVSYHNWKGKTYKNSNFANTIISDLGMYTYYYSFTSNGSDFTSFSKQLTYIISSIVIDYLSAVRFSIVSEEGAYSSDEFKNHLGKARYFRNQKDKDNNRYTYSKVGKAFKYLFPHLPVSIVTEIAEIAKERYPDKVETLYIHESYDRDAFSYAYGMSNGKTKNPKLNEHFSSLMSSCMRSPVKRPTGDFGPTENTVDDAYRNDSTKFYSVYESIYQSGVHPAEVYASGDFSIVYITNSSDPYDPNASVYARSNIAHYDDLFTDEGKELLQQDDDFHNVDNYVYIMPIYTVSELASSMMIEYLCSKYRLPTDINENISYHSKNKGEYPLPFSAGRNCEQNFLTSYLKNDKYKEIRRMGCIELRSNKIKEYYDKFFKRNMRFNAFLLEGNSSIQFTTSMFKQKYNIKNTFSTVYFDVRNYMDIKDDSDYRYVLTYDNKNKFTSIDEINELPEDQVMYFEKASILNQLDYSSINTFFSYYTGMETANQIRLPDKLCMITGNMFLETDVIDSIYYTVDDNNKIVRTKGFISKNYINDKSNNVIYNSLIGSYGAVYDNTLFDVVHITTPNYERHYKKLILKNDNEFYKQYTKLTDRGCYINKKFNKTIILNGHKFSVSLDSRYLAYDDETDTYYDYRRGLPTIQF